jgi:hypothetical protein
MHGIAEIFATATYSPLQHNRLIYAGRAGTGIGHAELERLWHRLQPLATPRMPLDKPPPRDSRFGSPLVLSRVHWVRPELSAKPTRPWVCVLRANKGGHFAIATAAGRIASPAAVICFSKFAVATACT